MDLYFKNQRLQWRKIGKMIEHRIFSIPKTSYLCSLNSVSTIDVNTVGGKAASLGEMLALTSKYNISVPSGFVLTVKSYLEFLEYNDIDTDIFDPQIDGSGVNGSDIVGSGVDGSDARSSSIPIISDLEEKRNTYLREVLYGSFPPDILEEISSAYQVMEFYYNMPNVDVAIRSSSSAEDCIDASFAGQYDTFLNVSGIKDVLIAIKKCFVSVFNTRAILYRQSRGYEYNPSIAVVVQRMVRSDLGSAGVAFSLDPESGWNSVCIINGSYGLGELVVQGEVIPDEFVYFKPTQTLISQTLGKKDRKLIYSEKDVITNNSTSLANVSLEDQNKFCLNSDQALLLSQWVCSLETHYSELKNKKCPVDVEWAFDGTDLYLVQVRPETVHSNKLVSNSRKYSIDTTGHKRLAAGIAVGQGISSGKIRIILEYSRAAEHSFQTGDVLVAPNTTPDWESIMMRASAIVTDSGGRTCHAAIIARELGIPAIVGLTSFKDTHNTEDGIRATEGLKLREGQMVTVSCAEGERGFLYSGKLPFTVVETDLNEIRRKMECLPVRMCLNIGSPDIAFKYASLPNKGVGLARLEFIIASTIRAHTKALIDYDSGALENRAEITKLISGYSNGKEFFINKLANGVGKIAASVFPHQCIVRFSDFKSDEYRDLLGGIKFEPQEQDAMLGWRGASRYYSPLYEDAFGLECQAVKFVKERMRLTNVAVMIPFCRTVEELKKVLIIMRKYGLTRDMNDANRIKIYLMAEIPSNILLANEFAKDIDGFSIGSNDLTMLVLGQNRSSNSIFISDERDPAVKKMILKLLKVGKRLKIDVGICGQSCSDFPDFASFLMENGINSISVTPDAMEKTVETLYNRHMELNST